MDVSSPAVIALHRSLVEIMVRLGRCEERLGLDAEPRALATFGKSHVPAPGEPCTCDEAVQLRQELAAVTSALDICRRERGQILDRLAALGVTP